MTGLFGRLLWAEQFFFFCSFKLQAEINYLGQLQHPNLVKLVGYCFEDDHRLLVYEFMPRGSMENHLFRSEFLMIFELAATFSLLLTWRVGLSVTLSNSEIYICLTKALSKIWNRRVTLPASFLEHSHESGPWCC